MKEYFIKTLANQSFQLEATKNSKFQGVGFYLSDLATELRLLPKIEDGKYGVRSFDSDLSIVVEGGTITITQFQHKGWLYRIDFDLKKIAISTLKTQEEA